jgi:hypothetical protein
MGTWEHRNIVDLHNSLGIFCWGRSLKIQREIKRERFLRFSKCGPATVKEKFHAIRHPPITLQKFTCK